MGYATCQTFLKAGAKVVMCDIKESEGEAAAASLSSLGEIHFVKADISKSADVAALINAVVDKFGRLDCAINNAARTPDSTPLTEFDEEYWRSIIDINLTGTALCCKYEMQQMIKQGDKKGTIVNIASINAFKPQPNMPAYTAAKHAIVGITKHASMEGGPHGIRVNAIAPGAIYVSIPTINRFVIHSYCITVRLVLMFCSVGDVCCGSRCHEDDRGGVCGWVQLSGTIWHASRGCSGVDVAVI